MSQKRVPLTTWLQEACTDGPRVGGELTRFGTGVHPHKDIQR